MSSKGPGSELWRELERIQRDWLTGQSGRSRAVDAQGVLRRAGQAVWEQAADPMRRVQRVRDALSQSGPLARELAVQRLSGLDLSDIWTILLDACKEVALVYGGSVVAGAALGAVVGAFGAGVGAVPGAMAGAGAGTQVGAWVLALLGLKSLIEDLGEAMPEAVQHYEKGFRLAWGAAPQSTRAPMSAAVDPLGSVSVPSAASSFAMGHLVLLLSMLTALVAYLSRGRGNRTQLLQEIRQSPRLGPKVADWVAANEAKLTVHPSLRYRPGGKASPTSTGAGPAQTPSQLSGRNRGNDEPGDSPPSPPKVMPRKKVPCFNANDLPASKLPEFDRQLAGQEAGLNNMTVDEYLKGREAFVGKGVQRNSQIARQARVEYGEQLHADLFEQFRMDGMSAMEADMKASEKTAEKMSALAALHNPDMIAAGRDEIADFGDRNVNSRIGSQWRSRVGELDQAAESIPLTDRHQTKLNARLERCK